MALLLWECHVAALYGPSSRCRRGPQGPATSTWSPRPFLCSPRVVSRSIRINSSTNTRICCTQRNVRALTSSETELAKCDLLDVLGDLERGLASSDLAANQKLLKAISALEDSQENAETTSDELLSATWKLLWTTEKETLFILKWSPLFGTKAGDVFQPISVQDGTLSNVITFPPEGSFVVNSTIKVVGPQRVAFCFNKAALKLPGRQIGLPPYGSGWFDNVYIDDQLRISKDSRGDVLITEKGTPTEALLAALS